MRSLSLEQIETALAVVASLDHDDRRNSRDWIKIRGARQNNLKNVSLDIPRDKLVVITGLSGSGKSSLAFDTFYASYRFLL